MIIQKNSHSNQTENLDTCLIESTRVQTELEACDFNLKTLNDISKDIYSIVETDTILKNFLLMCMGNFGILKGFALLMSVDEEPTDHFASFGFMEDDVENLRADCRQCIFHGKHHETALNGQPMKCRDVVPHGVEDIYPFVVEPGLQGILGLGPRIMAYTYNAKERELLETLINSLVVALQNAKSFESILSLNRDLEE